MGKRSVKATFRRVATVLAVLAVTGATMVSTAAPASAATTLSLAGHGWGHGRGLGQWGSYGYAVDHGWSSAQILDHYYGGTTAGTRVDDGISVQLTEWTGKTVAVTSGAPFQVGSWGEPGSGLPLVGAGSLAEVFQSGGKWYMQTWAGGCSRTAGPYGPYEIGEPTMAPSAPGESLPSLLTLCGSSQRTYRGSMRIVSSSTTTNLVNFLPMESYLRGVVPRESPASWASEGVTDPATGKPRGFQAIAAQAVAARSYAWAENRSPGGWKTCDTTSCQVYGGAYLNGAHIEDSRSDAAIAATAGVVRMRDGTVARTEFSSSTGGWTAGGTFTAVEDLGDSRSPYHDWSVTLTASQIQAKYPNIGQFTGIRVTSRNGFGDQGGRVLGMQVIGTSGTVTTTGNAFQSAFGLRSNWFAPQAPTQLTWLLRQTPTSGDPQVNVPYGTPRDIPLACDFDGDGADGLTVYQGNTFYGRSSTTAGSPQVSATYGATSYVPLCGDWDGDGKDGIGVYVDGYWYLRNTPTPGAPDLVIHYGYRGATPVVGDWNGDGKDGIGVFDSGSWLLRQTATAGAPELAPRYGIAGYVPVVGDWDGAPGDGIGVYVGGTWYLRNTATAGAPQVTAAFGAPGNRPVAGDWDGPGGSGLGLAVAE